MYLLRKYQTVTYSYDSAKEYMEHREQLQDTGWHFDNATLDVQNRLCATYSSILDSAMETVRQAIDKSKSAVVVIKCGNKVLFNDTIEFLRQETRISDRILCEKVVISKNEANQVLTLVVQYE